MIYHYFTLPMWAASTYLPEMFGDLRRLLIEELLSDVCI